NRLNKTNAQAADIDKIINWTLKLFSELPAKNKVLLLQYYRNLSTSEAVLNERQTILKASADIPIKTVDTFEELQKYNPTELWKEVGEHHTAFGNKIICGLLYEEAFARR